MASRWKLWILRVCITAICLWAVIGGIGNQQGRKLHAEEPPAAPPVAASKAGTSVASEEEEASAKSRPAADKPVKLEDAIAALDSPSHFQRNLRDVVIRLLKSQDFKQLDALADKLRANQSRLPVGELKLTHLHHELSRTFETPAEFEERIALYNDWVKQAPDSITARLALASAWKNYGWQAHGGGYANTVSEDAAALFQARVFKAAEVVEAAKKLPVKDPELYAISIWLAIAQAWPEKKVAQICRDSAELDPSFLRTFVEATNYYFPKWYGEPGQVEQFALDAVKLTEKRCGKMVYMQIVQEAELNYAYDAFDRFDFSWPLVQQAYSDWKQRFSADKWRREVYCRLACLARDRDTAHALFEKISAQGDANRLVQSRHLLLFQTLGRTGFRPRRPARHYRDRLHSPVGRGLAAPSPTPSSCRNPCPTFRC